jgi:hypothetical protein
MPTHRPKLVKECAYPVQEKNFKIFFSTQHFEKIRTHGRQAITPNGMELYLVGLL